MKNDYIARATHFAKEIIPFIEEGLILTMNTNDYLNEYVYALSLFENGIKRYNETRHRQVILDHGASRVALITSDYVIKFDRRPGGTFAGSCEKELKGYQFACENGFDYLFAEITKITVKSYQLYIMPRIYGIYDNDEDLLSAGYLDEEEQDFIEAYYADIHQNNYGWRDGNPIIFDYAWNYC